MLLLVWSYFIGLGEPRSESNRDRGSIDPIDSKVERVGVSSEGTGLRFTKVLRCYCSMPLSCGVIS